MRTFFGLTAIALALAACGSKAPGPTPKATFEAMKSAAESSDFGAMYDLLSPDMKKQTESAYEDLRGQAKMSPAMAQSNEVWKAALNSKSAREFFITAGKAKTPAAEKQRTDMEKAKFLDSKVDGDHATVKYEVGGETKSMEMVKVDGKWYLGQHPS